MVASPKVFVKSGSVVITFAFLSIAKSIFTEAEPPELVAVIVYSVSAEYSVGIPLITPVCVLKVRPAGKFGAIE